VIVAEENLTGLYGTAIRHLFSGLRLAAVNTIGRMISPDDIIARIVECTGSPEEAA
jgi:hypothetical protein